MSGDVQTRKYMYREVNDVPDSLLISIPLAHFSQKDIFCFLKFY